MLFGKLGLLAAAGLALALGRPLAQQALADTPPAPLVAPAPPADAAATPATRQLLANLHRLVGHATLFGHQDDLAYGLTPEGKRWIGEANRSDVQAVAGAYPALFGWELGHLELDSARNLDGVPFAKMRGYIRQAYELGAVNTISWHLDNPRNGHSAWDTARTVRYILPGGPNHARYVQYLDRVAAFLGSLKGAKGEAIPVVFRPFHEHTGNWFWWGKEACTPAEYVALWQFTVKYLRDTKQLHNLLIAYSAADFSTEAEYLERYPGDNYADVLGFDAYYFQSADNFRRDLETRLPLLERIGAAHGKVPALTETGAERLPDPTWWTAQLLPELKKYPVAYVMVWRNGRPDHYYAPYPGQASAADFRQFAADKQVLLSKQLGAMKIYTSTIKN